MRKWISRILLLAAVILIAIPIIRDDIEVEKSEEVVEKWENEEEIEGLLEIPAIDLKLGIKHGAIHDNMRYTAATMTHEKPKKNKNFTLAGHRNIRKGKNFNRLNEVELGDAIIVNNKYEYIVTDKFIVEPSEVDILEDKGKTEITLITCYPISISTHRLVIKGEMI